MSDNENTLGSIFDFSEDISQQEAPPPLPVGNYLATVTAAEAKVSKNSGNTYADISFSIAPDQFAPDFAAVQQDAVVLHHRTLVIKDDARSRWAIRRFCEALRVPVNRQLDLNSFIGKPAMLKIKHSEYQGQKRADIEAVEAA